MGNPHLITRHLGRIGEEKEHSGGDGHIEDVHTRSAEDFLCENHSESHGQGQHPQGGVDGDDEWDDDSRHKITLLYLLAFPLGPGKLYAQAHNIAHKDLGQHCQEAI